MRTPLRSISTPDETVGQHNVRVAKEGYRKPLRSLKEMAEEFGVSVHALSAFIRHDTDAPKPKYRTGGRNMPKNAWVDPDAMRNWWNKRKES